jgi:hypothetical protein
MKEYELTHSNFGRIAAKRQSSELQCNYCRKPLKIGDHVVSKSKKFWHKACYESMFIDLADVEGCEEEAVKLYE